MQSISKIITCTTPKLVSTRNSTLFSSPPNFVRYAPSQLGVQYLVVASYVSRAHPKKADEFAIPEAMDSLLTGAETRRTNREKRWERNRPVRKEKGLSDDGGPFRNQDETIDLAINMNLDPRKPGQALRGSIKLPNGPLKKSFCAVFTHDEDIQEQAKQAGASYTGGEELLDQIVSGDIPLTSFQRALATQDIMPSLSKKAARILGPRGMMPNAKVGTLLNTKDEILEALEAQLAGNEIQFRTDQQGILHVPVGKASFGNEKIMENIATVMKQVYRVKPESYGKDKKNKKGKKQKAGKNPKYILSAFVSCTQGPGFKIDLKTLDPSSPFFMKSVSTN